jgi:hypothetical protein
MYIPSTIDSDASSIISAIASASGSFDYSSLLASATEGHTKDAINTFVIKMKNAGLWDKVLALYGHVGGNQESNSVNWKNPGTNNIIWNGTLTHALTGVKSDGATGYGNTGILLTAVGSSSSGWVAEYSRTIMNYTRQQYEVGAYSPGGANQGIRLWASTNAYPTNTRGVTIGGSDTSAAKFNSDDSSGLFIGSRTSPTLQTIYRNGVAKSTHTATVTGTTDINIYVNALNAGGSMTNASLIETSMIILGNVSYGALDLSEAANIYDIVQDLQTRLGRAV